MTINHYGHLFQIAGNLDKNKNRYPYIIVLGNGEVRDLKTQHRDLSNAAVKAQALAGKTGERVVIIDRRSGEFWSNTWIQNYGR